MIPLTPQKQALLDSVKAAREQGVAYQYLDDEEFKGRKVRLNGKEVLNFGNCCYLGLEIDPRIKEGVINATEKYGSLLSNSRAYFSSPLYTEFESQIKKIFPGHQVVTTTTTLGHCAVLPVMIERDDEIILDQYAHNSVRMAASICKAAGTGITTVRHNDMKHLSTVIQRLKKRGAKNIWFLGDGIYSMQGEFLDLDGLTELLDEHQDLYAYIDDAHGMSWMGKNGAGYVLGNGKIHEKMIVAVSMCKSFGAFGGIVVFPHEEWAERVRLFGQTLLFSAPISPPILGAAIASAKIHQSDELEALQKGLRDRISYFRQKCAEAGIPVKTISNTPVQFIEIGESLRVFESIKELVNNGIFVTAAAYPSMPKNHGGVRVSITLHVTFEDIDYLVEQLVRLDINNKRTPESQDDVKEKAA